MSIRTGAHAELAVQDLEGVVGFHTDVIGMVELGRHDGKVCLGCGLDSACDLILREGGTGVSALALEVDSDEDLDEYARVLHARGLETGSRSDPGPGVSRALRFTAPNGLPLDLVTVGSGTPYVSPPDAPSRRGIGALDFDHITLKVPDPVAMVDFLTSVLGFAVSDEMRPSPDTLLAAWTRVGSQHHDVAMFKGPDTQTLHHYAFRLESFDHLKQAADRLAAAEVAVEAGPGRHTVGGNVYLFFWAPGGNRYEFSAEMPNVAGGGPKVWSDLPTAFSAWGALPPESFADGS